MTIAAQPAGTGPQRRRRRRRHPHGRAHEGVRRPGRPGPRGGVARPRRSQRGEVFGLLGPNGAGKTTTVGMLTTRVIPTSGEAWVGGIDVVAHPAAAKQVIGVVPQTNTLDRSLDVVGEPLLPRSLLRHERQGSAPQDRRAARAVPARRPGQGRRRRAVGRHGAAPDGGAGDHARARRAVPRRAHLGTRPAEPPRALGRHPRAPRATARRSCSRRTTWKRPTSSAERVAIVDHGRLLALDTPEQLKATIGADTELRIQASGDLQALANDLAALPGHRQRARRRRRRVRVRRPTAARRSPT